MLGCALSDVPGLYQHISERGLLALDGVTIRRFGEMVQVAFTELILNPSRFPQARNSFVIAISKLGVDLGQQCLTMLGGQEERLDKLLKTLDVTSDSGGLSGWLSQVDIALASGFESLTIQVAELGNKIGQNTDSFQQLDAKLGQGIEQILAAVTAQNTSSQEPLARQAMIALASQLRPDERLDFQRAKQELELAVCAAQDLIRKGETSRYQDRFVDETHACVSRSIEEGQLDQGSHTIDQAFAELDRREASAREVATRQRKQLLDLSIKYGTAAHDPQRVADAEEMLLRIEHEDCLGINEKYRSRLAYYFEEGEKRNVNFFLNVAVALARKRVESASGGRERSDALNWLGKSLARLGERTSSNLLLQKAEQVFREASDSLEDSMPLDWTIAQNGLANVLQMQARREHCNDKFYEAARVYQAIRLVYAEEKLPLELAETHVNLGAVLWAIGEREGDLVHLREAVRTLRMALNEPAILDKPFVWAMAQNNLGNTLRLIGEREGNNELLREAVEAFRAALEKRTQENAPFLWATTQNDLGNALMILGERARSTELVREAISAYQASLVDRIRDYAPLEWATRQHNLGTACLRVGEFEKDVTMLRQAEEALGFALQERKPHLVLQRWAGTMKSLGNVFLALGQHEDNPQELLRAKQIYEEALGPLSKEIEPWEWASINYNLGNVSQALADYEDGTESLHAAARAFQDALIIRTPDRGRSAWERTKVALGDVFFLIGLRETGNEHLNRAIQEYGGVLPELSSHLRESVVRRIASLQELLDERNNEGG